VLNYTENARDLRWKRQQLMLKQHVSRDRSGVERGVQTTRAALRVAVEWGAAEPAVRV
jgi:hypothetical protein